MKNNKGYAISAIVYPLLLICFVLILSILENLNDKQTLLNNIKDKIKNGSSVVTLIINGEEQTREISKIKNTEFIVNDITGMTNIVCNNGAIPNVENNVLKVSNIYGDTTCTINSSLKTTIDNLDETETNIVMLNNESLTTVLQLKANKNVTLDLKGKELTTNQTILLANDGILNIKSTEDGGTMIAPSCVLYSRNNGIINIYSGAYINTASANDGRATLVIGQKGTINVYGDKAIFGTNNEYVSGTYLEGNGNSVSNISTDGGTVNIYNGTLKMNGTIAAIRSNVASNDVIYNVYGGEIIAGTHAVGLDANCIETAQINIYGGNIMAEQYYAVYNNSTGTINIYGGVISSNNYTVFNRAAGTINIEQKNNPIYITSLAETFNTSVANVTGTVNISGNLANKCTTNSSDTTSGLCIYSPSSSNGGVMQSTGGVTNINGGTIYGGNIGVSNHNDGTINIKDGHITGGIYGTYNARAGIINITGGTLISNTDSAVRNISTGTINIIQTDKPIYIASYAQTWQPAVANENAGTINISGSEANNCTVNYTDTTSGLCIYAEGDKNYSSNTSNTAVANTCGENNIGIVNINGGTFIGGYMAISNHYSGIVNIKSGNIQSGLHAIVNMRAGTVNVCNAKVNSLRYDIYASNNATGILNYSPNVIFTSGNNTPVIGGQTNTIIPNYSGTCTQ